MNIITRMINWINGRYIKTVNNESIFGSGNIAGGGSGSLDPGDGIRIQDGIVSAKVDNTTIGFDVNGNLKTLGEAGVTKQYVDNQDQALQDQIDLKQDDITDSIDTHNITDDDYLSDFNDTLNKRRSVLKLWNYILSKMVGAISTVLTDNLAANRAVITDSNGKLTVADAITANTTNGIKSIAVDQYGRVSTYTVKTLGRGISDSSNEIGHSNSVTPPSTDARIIVGVLDEQGHFKETPTGFQYSDVYNSSIDNCLFTRKGANNLYNWAKITDVSGSNAVTTIGMDSALSRTSASHQSTVSRIMKYCGVVSLQYFGQYSASSEISAKFTCIGSVPDDYKPVSQVAIQVTTWNATPSGCASGYVTSDGKIYVWVSSITRGATNIQYVINATWKAA